jgi:GTPase
MVLVSPMLHPEACQEFEADVFVLYHGSKSISKNFQTVVHVNNVMQTAIIVKLSQVLILVNY